MGPCSGKSEDLSVMSHVMRKPVYAICEQQRRRSACASPINSSTWYSRIFKILASLCSSAGRFESYLVANPEDRFSRDVALMGMINLQTLPTHRRKPRKQFFSWRGSNGNDKSSNVSHAQTLSLVTKKPGFGVCDQLRLKQACWRGYSD